MSIKTEKIFCPTCQAQHTWTPDNAFRPFCSYRCKLIDLGEWADEGHRIPGEPVMDSPEESDIPNDEDRED
jgi:endogenous inhibitor of DNA gyrase (YacG/DUF329 family)